MYAYEDLEKLRGASSSNTRERAVMYACFCVSACACAYAYACARACACARARAYMRVRACIMRVFTVFSHCRLY